MIIIETCPKCGADLISTVIATFPPIPRKVCPNCSWHWEGRQEEIKRIPFQEKEDMTTLSMQNESGVSFCRYSMSACQYCATNPANGGTGLCYCALGTPQIT